MKGPESWAEVCSPRIKVGRVWRWGRGGILSPQARPGVAAWAGPSVLPGCAVQWPLASCGRSSLIFNELKRYKRRHSGSQSHLPHCKHSTATRGRGRGRSSTEHRHRVLSPPRGKFRWAARPQGCGSKQRQPCRAAWGREAPTPDGPQRAGSGSLCTEQRDHRRVPRFSTGAFWQDPSPWLRIILRAMEGLASGPPTCIP